MPSELKRSALASRHIGTVYMMLEYLAEKGGREDLVIIKPFVLHENAAVRQMAARFLGRVEGK